MSDIMPSPGELLRQHALAAVRDERDAALEENKRLRDLYENAVGLRERFGWTINHLLECEVALAGFQAEAANFEAERDEARQQRDELFEAIEALTGAARKGGITVELRERVYDTAKRIRGTSGE